jgi:hypothetical protein
MRGGAIPLLAWGVLLAVLGAMNWIWTGDAIQVGTFGFSIVVVVGGAIAVVFLCRDALRPGPPEPRSDPEAIPDVSVGAVLTGVSVGAILFGFVFGTFFIYSGLGMLAASLVRLGLEVRAERREERSLKGPPS